MSTTQSLQPPLDNQPLAEEAHGEHITGMEDTVLVDGRPPLYLIVMGLLLLTLVFVAWYSFSLGVGSFRRPGPGLWILVAAVVALVAFPAAYFAKQQYEIFRRERVIRMIAMLIGLIAFAVLYPLTGFIIAGFISLLIITRWSAEESWRTVIILAVATPVVLYLIFGYFFQVGFTALPGWMV